MLALESQDYREINAHDANFFCTFPFGKYLSNIYSDRRTIPRIYGSVHKVYGERYNAKKDVTAALASLAYVCRV